MGVDRAPGNADRVHLSHRRARATSATAAYSRVASQWGHDDRTQMSQVQYRRTIPVPGLIVRLRTGNRSRHTVLVSSATTSIADMIGRIDEVVVDCANPRVLAQFWSAVLGGAPCARDDSWHYVDPPGWTRLAFQKVPEGKIVKNRLHLDVGVSDIAAATRQAEVLGAQRVGGSHGDAAGSFQVLLDPEGNEWCLVQPA